MFSPGRDLSMAFQIRVAHGGWAVLLGLIAFTPCSWGQAKSDAARSQEFVESRSPIRDGGVIVSRSVAGLPMETRTLAASQLPAPGSPSLAGNPSTAAPPSAILPPTAVPPGAPYSAGNPAPVSTLPPIPPAGGYPYPVASSTSPLTGYAITPAQGAALKNMPPGTYPGKGIFNRPTTYTDGQPMRNFFRYLFPH